MLESINSGDEKVYTTIGEASKKAEEGEKERLLKFQDKILSIALFTNHPALKGINVRNLTEEDKALFEKENLTISDIQAQKRVLLDMSEVDRAKEIFAAIQKGEVARGLTGDDLTIFSKLKTGRLTEDDIERQEQGLKEKSELVKDSLMLLEYLKTTVVH